MLEWLVHCVLNVFEGTYNLLSNEQKVQKYINGAEDAIGQCAGIIRELNLGGSTMGMEVCWNGLITAGWASSLAVWASTLTG